MKFDLMCWDHARFVTNTAHPYDELAREMEAKKALGIETVVIYLQPGVLPLDDYCRAAAAAGVKVEGWITPNKFIEDPIRRTLSEEKWVEMEKRYKIRLSGPCLNHEHNRKSMLENVEKLATDYRGRFSALHLDYIRNDNAILTREYPCECEACRALRLRHFGQEVLSPEALKEPAILYKEYEIKNRFVTEVVTKIKAISNQNGLKLTMAARANYVNQADITDPPVWGLGPAVLEGQDWVLWGDNGYVDAIYSMNYHTDETLFTKVLKDHVRLMRGSKAALYSGVGVSSSMGSNPPDQVARYIDQVKAAGLPGCIFFNKDDVFTSGHAKVLKEAVGK